MRWQRLRLEKLIRYSLLAGLVLLLFFVGMAAASELVSSGELVENASLYDGKTVVFRGEVIGDVMVRGDYAWINVNDDTYSSGSRELSGYNSGQSIWCKAQDVEFIKITGDYRHVGDCIEVVGVFNRACAEHGGDMDIHAEEIRLIKRGSAIPRPVEFSRIWACLILFTTSLSLFSLGRYLRYKRERREKVKGAAI